jgi:hypothetical protein
MTIQRLVLDFRGEGGGLVVRCFYCTQDGLNPGMQAHTKVVADLARGGLTQAREALDGGAEYVGTSGHAIREDVLLATASLDALETQMQVKAGCGVSYRCPACSRRIKHAVHRPDGPQDALPRWRLLGAGAARSRAQGTSGGGLALRAPEELRRPGGRMSCRGDSYKVGDSVKA